jgi:uncharacterized membrane protein YgcG
MPEAYELHEGRYIQEYVVSSAANAVLLQGNIVPAGKVWTILSACYFPSAAETKIIEYSVIARSSSRNAISIPVSILLDATMRLPLLTEGMELKIFPGESLYVARDSATAGSTMTLIVRFIEADLPFYAYEEPQKKVVKVSQKHGSVYRSGGGISEHGTPSSGHGTPGGGGGGGPEPV